MRAYGSTAKACLQSVPPAIVAQTEKLTWRVALEDVPAVLSVCSAGRLPIESQEFHSAHAEISVQVVASRRDEIAQKIGAATQGRAILTTTEKTDSDSG